MHITITGMLGSGKSTICKIISEQKGYEIYSTGKIQRQVASQKGVTTLELNKMMVEHPELDSIIDNETIRISDENKNRTIIFDSRMAWFFVKESYKIFLTVDPFVSAQRVTKADRGDVEGYADVHEAKLKLIERAQAEHERFIRIYNADYWDYCNYDLVLDATWHDPDTLASIIMGHMDIFMENRKKEKIILMSPKSLYPSFTAKNESNIQKDSKFWNAAHVQIVSRNHYNYILKGHAVVLKALENKTELIKVLCIKDNQADNLIIDNDSVNLFENMGEFKYSSLPDNVI